MNILFKPRVEATEQMTLNRDNRTFRNPRINESAKLRLRDGSLFMGMTRSDKK